jgi:hypothetical protein
VKGLTHFVAGVAVASCFPEAVRAAADGQPLPMLLGGICGLLPDTLDFKFARFAYRHEIEVIPDPLAPDPQMIADAVAHAIHRARATGRPVSIKLSTVRVSAAEWLQYRIVLDPLARRVVARCTGRVTTDRRPVPGGPARPPEAEAALECPVAIDYQAETTVDIFDGPVFRMEPMPDGRVHARFIPWHRAWSHSVVPAALLGLGAGLVWGPAAGWIATLAYVAHILADQLGFLGSNWLAPFTRARTAGFHLAHSDDAFLNLALIWGSALLVFWNLARPTPHAVALVPLLLYGALLPLAALRLLGRFCLRPADRSP